MPALTIVMSTHNAMPYLPAAILSICEQTFRDFIFLIIDDGSTDNTGDCLEQLSDPRIHVIRTRHRGVSAALNQGLALCETEFLACMDADDLALPERFERQLGFLRQNPEVGMVGCQFSYFGGPGTRVFSPFLPCDHDEIMRETLGRRLAIAHATLMFRTWVLRAVGGYRVADMGHDWDVFLRLGEAARVANLPEVLYLYRMHRGNSDLSRFIEVRTGVEYACYCAAARLAGRPEPSHEEFRRRQRARPWLVQRIELIDAYAMSQYRIALVALAERRLVRGYGRLLWSALCSPARTARRLRRMLGRWH